MTVSSTPPPNPYAGGVKVAGTGPGGASSNWATSWDPQLGMYVANTGFGIAPIFTPDQASSFAQTGPADPLTGLTSQEIPYQNAPAPLNAADFYQMSLAGGNPYLSLFQPGGGGQQDISYTLDPKTGYYIPSSAQGVGGGSNLFDQLVKAGVLATGTLGTADVLAGANVLAPAAATGAPAAATDPMTQAFIQAGQAYQPAATAGLPQLAQAGTTATDVTAGTTGALDTSGALTQVGTLGVPGTTLTGAPTAPDWFAAGAGAGVPSAADTSVTQALVDTALQTGGTGAGGGFLSQLGDFLTSPRGLITAGGLGLSLAQSLNKPGLPSTGQAVAGPAQALLPGAQQTIQSGGTGAPAWQGQKAAIDAAIDQQIQQQSEAMMQAAINSGMGADSQVTQQKINQIKDQLNVQRQQLYQQQLATNVTEALTAMTNSNSALTSLASMQWQQDQAALQNAFNTAGLSLRIAGLLPTGSPGQPGNQPS